MRNKKYLSKRHLLILIICAFFLFPQTAYLSAIESAKLIDLTNKERIKNNLLPLKINSKLTTSSTAKLLDMFDKQYFQHNTPEGEKFSKFVIEKDYDFLYAGENLAIDFKQSEDILKAWLDSPAHKKNILNSRYDDIGIAVGTGELFDTETTIVVQHFGKTYPSIHPSLANLPYVKGDITIKDNQIRRFVPYLEEYEENIIPKDAGLLKNIKGNIQIFKKMNYNDSINIFTIINSFLVLISSLIILHLFLLSIKISHQKVKKLKNKK